MWLLAVTVKLIAKTLFMQAYRLIGLLTTVSKWKVCIEESLGHWLLEVVSHWLLSKNVDSPNGWWVVADKSSTMQTMGSCGNLLANKPIKRRFLVQQIVCGQLHPGDSQWPITNQRGNIHCSLMTKGCQRGCWPVWPKQTKKINNCVKPTSLCYIIDPGMGQHQLEIGFNERN